MQHHEPTPRPEPPSEPLAIPVRHIQRSEPVAVRVTANAPRRAPRYRVVAVGARRLRVRAEVG